jgi:carbamoyltransferase
MSDTHILGLNAYHGDSSAALLSNGELTAAVEEERYNRIKHWAGLPAEAAAGCLAMSGVDNVQHVAVSRNPSANLFSKMLRVARQPSLIRNATGRAVNSVRITQIKSDLASGGVHGVANAKLHFVEHHRAHMASAFFASPFEEAAVVSVDGFGDFSSVMWGVGRGNKMEIRGGPVSTFLGLFYTAFTQFRFSKYGDEYKMRPGCLRRTSVSRKGSPGNSRRRRSRHFESGLLPPPYRFGQHELGWC